MWSCCCCSTCCRSGARALRASLGAIRCTRLLPRVQLAPVGCSSVLHAYAPRGAYLEHQPGMIPPLPVGSCPAIWSKQGAALQPAVARAEHPEAALAVGSTAVTAAGGAVHALPVVQVVASSISGIGTPCRLCAAAGQPRDTRGAAFDEGRPMDECVLDACMTKGQVPPCVMIT